jgi:hypothetical protein
MVKHSLLKDLQDLVNKIDVIDMPYQKGNHIRIGPTIITERRRDYTVYNIKTRQEYVLFCKTSAVALAKDIANNKTNTDRILELDRRIAKNYMDCMFYRHSLSKAKTTERKEILGTRYDIAKAETRNAKDKLDDYIF